jgi:hypothetical protein
MVGAFVAPLISAPSPSSASGVFDPNLTSAVIDDTTRWSSLISSVSTSFQVPPEVIRAIVIVESGGEPFAYSEDLVAFGLAQVTKDIEAQSALEGLGDVFDPETNLRLAAEVLARAHERWGSWDMAIMHWHDVRRQHDPGFTSGYTWQSASYLYLDRVRAVMRELGYVDHYEEVRADALLHALTAVGMPYVWAGQSWETGGFDCSGLVRWAYAYAGVEMPAGTVDQWNVTDRILEHEARPGDLVFFAGTWSWGISHVGIYMGDGMMLHSPTEGKVVEIIPVHGPYWGAHLAGFGRVPVSPPPLTTGTLPE